MALPEMTEMQKRMYEAVGHVVEIKLKDDQRRFIGKCTGYTKPLDNEPEIATMDLRVEGVQFIYEFAEAEIENIIIRE